MLLKYPETLGIEEYQLPMSWRVLTTLLKKKEMLKKIIQYMDGKATIVVQTELHITLKIHWIVLKNLKCGLMTKKILGNPQ